MKISIVTPSFNSAKFIEDAIVSVLSQSYDNFEHIIIDGGSTDRTLDILKKYSHLIWVSEADKGQSDALNKGFRMAQGEIVGWLNADDYYLPGTLTKVATCLSDHPDADVIYGNYYFVNEAGTIIRKRKEIGLDPGILFYFGCYIPSTGSFFRKRVFEQGFFLNIDFHITMDYEYFIRLARAKKKFVHIPEYLFCFRWHDDNKSLNAVLRRAERYKVQEMYGIRFSRNPILNQKIYNALFWPYRFKRGFKKLSKGCYF